MYSILTVRHDSLEDRWIQVENKEDIWGIYLGFISGVFKKCEIWELDANGELSNRLYPIKLESGVVYTSEAMVGVIGDSILTDGILRQMMVAPNEQYYDRGAQVVSVDGNWYYKQGSLPYEFALHLDSGKAYNNLTDLPDGRYETVWGQEFKVDNGTIID